MEMNLDEMMKKAEDQLCHLSEEQQATYKKFTQMAKEGKRPTFNESRQLKKLFKDLTKLNEKSRMEIRVVEEPAPVEQELR